MAKLAQVENPFTLRNHIHTHTQKKKRKRKECGASGTTSFMAAENLGDGDRAEEINAEEGNLFSHKRFLSPLRH